MRIQPRPNFVAKVLDALPADGAPISSRGVFLAIGEISTPAYVRIVLRQLAIAGNVIATGPSGQRVYRRLPAQQEVSSDRLPCCLLDGVTHDAMPESVT